MSELNYLRLGQEYLFYFINGKGDWECRFCGSWALLHSAVGHKKDCIIPIIGEWQTEIDRLKAENEQIKDERDVAVDKFKGHLHLLEEYHQFCSEHKVGRAGSNVYRLVLEEARRSINLQQQNAKLVEALGPFGEMGQELEATGCDLTDEWCECIKTSVVVADFIHAFKLLAALTDKPEGGTDEG